MYIWAIDATETRIQCMLTMRDSSWTQLLLRQLSTVDRLLRSHNNSPGWTDLQSHKMIIKIRRIELKWKSLDQARRSNSKMKTLKSMTASATHGASRILFAADRTLVQASNMKPSQREGLWSIPVISLFQSEKFRLSHWTTHAALPPGFGGAKDWGWEDVDAPPDPSSEPLKYSISISFVLTPELDEVDPAAFIFLTWSTKTAGVIADMSAVSLRLWSRVLLAGVKVWPCDSTLSGGTPGAVTDTSCSERATPRWG